MNKKRDYYLAVVIELQCPGRSRALGKHLTYSFMSFPLLHTAATVVF